MNEIIWIILKNQGLMFQLLADICGDRKRRDAVFDYGNKICSLADEVREEEPKTNLELLSSVLEKAYEKGKQEQ